MAVNEDPATAAELFEDDFMKIVMRRLSVRLMPQVMGFELHIAVTLVDNKTMFATMCQGPSLVLQLAIPSAPGILARSSY